MHRLLKDALMTEGVPRIVAKGPEAQAFAFVVNQQIHKLLQFADGVAVVIRIDSIEEWKLNALAYNLRVAHYREDYPLDVRRDMVKKALLFRCLAGTVYVTAELAKQILGNDTKLYEWWEYEDDPGYFMLQVFDWALPDEAIEEFVRVMDCYKRLSAWLRKIMILIHPPAQHLHFGTALLRSRRTVMLRLPGLEATARFAMVRCKKTTYFSDFSYVGRNTE